MIKKIIFDIDNTLIPWNNKWWNIVGDSFINDIELALKLGIYCFYITDEDKKIKDNLYMHIKVLRI